MKETTTAEIARAASVLLAGGLVAFPTETVYGLGADASSPPALRRLYAVKRRPPDHPVIVHLAAVDQLEGWAASVPAGARRLADRWWPGPLTLVLPRARRVPDEVTGGLETVGVRVPDQPVALALLRAFGDGIAAPSANRFGKVSPTTAAAVRADLGGDVDAVLDGGRCRVGLESTIVDCAGDGFAILRVGAIGREQIEETVGETVRVRTDGSVRAPGALASHYAPDAIVVIVDAAALVDATRDALAVGRRVGVLASAVPRALDPAVEVLASPSDADEFARMLYAALREADERSLDVVFAVPPPETGIGAAVADRLRRAAGTRAAP